MWILSICQIPAQLVAQSCPTLHSGHRQRQLSGVPPGLAHPGQRPAGGHACQVALLEEHDPGAVAGELVRRGGTADPSADDDDVFRSRGCSAHLVLADVMFESQA